MAQFRLIGNSENPYHLSVGGVLIRDGEVYLIQKPDGLITLPRETAFVNESFESALKRGMSDELGLFVNVEWYLGSQITYFDRPDGTNIEKTTLYFSCSYQGESVRTPSSDEVLDKVILLNVEDAIKKLGKLNNPEFEILKRVKV